MKLLIELFILSQIVFFLKSGLFVYFHAYMLFAVFVKLKVPFDSKNSV